MSTIELEPGKMALGPLMSALQEMGYEVTHPRYKELAVYKDGKWVATYDGSTGVMKTQQRQAQFMQTLAPAYSKQVLLAQAKRFGWRVTEKPNNKFVVQKGFGL